MLATGALALGVMFSASACTASAPVPSSAATDPPAEEAPVSDATRELLAAATEGDADRVRTALADGADIEARGAGGTTALVAATKANRAAAARVLIEAGADPDHVNNLGWTALHEAIVLGDGSAVYAEAVRALIDGGADVSIRDGDGVLPRDLAVARGYDAPIAEIDR
ncbi:ankyrin repeat domain-containing protein [Microbacterium sp. NPDC008134]|uniref:ankyrin repeat domain-containing protein n=1 Tax=Microbacterium sp. NPDC008134 TaxID=3364183 RepID=UPI0036EDFD4A